MSVAFSPDGETIVDICDNSVIRLWSVEDGKTLFILKGHSDDVSSVAFSPDGKTVVSGSFDNTIRAWSVEDGETLHTLKGHSDGVTSVAFSPDGETVVSASFDKTIRLWSVKDGKTLLTLEGHSSNVASVAFSPDGKTVVSGSQDTTIRLWDARTGVEIEVLRGHSRLVNSVAFSPDGNTVVSGSWDGTIRLWDARTGAQLQTLWGHSREVWSVAFSPDGKTVVSGSLDSTVRLWSVTGVPIRELEHTSLRHSGFRSVAFSADGKTVVGLSNFFTTYLWNVEPEENIQRFEPRNVDAEESGKHDQEKRPCGDRLMSMCSLGLTGATIKESEHVFNLCLDEEDRSAELEAFLKMHPDVDVNLYESADGYRSIITAAALGHSASVRLLTDSNADLDACSDYDFTALRLASDKGHLKCVQILVSSKADVNAYDRAGIGPCHAAAHEGHPKCLDLLLTEAADVNAKTLNGSTPAIYACQGDHLTCLQLLVDAKADLSARTTARIDTVYSSMALPNKELAHRVRGMPFAVLSCNTNSKKVRITSTVTQTTVDAHIDEFKQIHAFIDDCHSVTKHALSEDVVVDTRVGRGDYGLYHEPLEQVLHYLGLSMKKNQTVSASIDGESGVKRALMPMHPVNANLWFELYQRTLCTSCGARQAYLRDCECHPTRQCDDVKTPPQNNWLYLALLVVMVAVIAKLMMP